MEVDQNSRTAFFHASINCEEIHPDINAIIDKQKVPLKSLDNTNFNTIIHLFPLII